MSGFLMDTSIVSGFSPGKPPLPPPTTEWLRTQGEEIYLPSLAIQEIRKGISRLDRAGGHDRAERLLMWLNGILDTYKEKILAVDSRVALIAGEMEDKAMADGRNPGLADVLIAATAKAHSLTLLTANLRHFQPLGITCLNPCEEMPAP